MLKAEPIYIPFLKRCFTNIYVGLLLIFVFSLVGFFQNKVNAENTVLLDVFIFAILFFVATTKNRLYLKYILIFPESKEVELVIYKYDKPYETKKLNIADCDLRIEQNIWSRYHSYSFNIYLNNKSIFKQTETGAWQTDVFLIIVKYFNDLKGKPSYLDSVPKRGTLSEYFIDKSNLIVQ